MTMADMPCHARCYSRRKAETTARLAAPRTVTHAYYSSKYHYEEMLADTDICAPLIDMCRLSLIAFGRADISAL